MSIERPVRTRDPAVSVVVPSVPDHDHARTVALLEAQAFDHPYEVIVVNDGSIDRSEARNRGIEAASVDVVALTDDDCEPPADWLARIRSAFLDPDLVCLEGGVYGGCRYTGTRRYLGCNVAVRRDAALAVGGYRSEYAGWREDTEFGWRLESKASGRCRYDDDLRMRHPTVPRTVPDLACERRLRAEYPERYREVIGTGPLHRLYLLARAAGIAPRINRLRNRLRRLLGPIRGERDADDGPA